MEPLTLPDEGWAEFVADRADSQLARCRELLAVLTDGTPRSAGEVLELWNDADLALRNAWVFAAFVAQVHPDETVRTLAEQREQEASRLATERGLDRELYDVMAGVEGSAGAGLDTEAKRMLQLTLRDFRRSGVDRPEQVRERLRAIAERATEVGQEFSRNIRDDVRTVRLRPEQLAGLPQDFLDAHPADADGLISLGTDYPDVIPFRTFAHDGPARRELMHAFLNRAWPANDALLHELLDLRAEQAALLGYPSWPDFDAETKMIGTGAAIGEFVDRITALADTAGRRDLEVLLQRRRQDEPGATGLDASASPYYSELVRREHYDVDAQQVRRYFDFAKVRAGLLDVTGRLFGLDYEPVPDAPRWHQDVAVYDVRLRDSAASEPIGRIHLDLHPREGKYKHAAQFDLVPGIAGRQLPEGVLVCNFPRGLMEHDDAVTLFHEFGHLLHHLLAGRHAWARFSGVATEWDFVEAPSQMLEEWAWDAEVLRSFATNAAGEPIPRELVAKMRAGKEFGKGLQARTQMFYAALAYHLHASVPEDITAVVRDLQARYDLFSYVPDTHFHASFGHLEGYTSGYYTYMWSLVIAKDLFSAFDPDDLFDPEIARRYRDRVLAPGGSADAADLVEDFLGRPYSFDAFQRWLDTGPGPA
jgi:thimet oligopeptidase